MGVFADAPIRRKITSLMVLVSILSLVVLAAAFIFIEIRTQHRSLVDKVATLADIVSESSAEGMILKRPDEVTKVLQSLNRERHLRAAFVFRDGEPFSQYLNPDKKTDIAGIPYFPCPLLKRAAKVRKQEYYFSARHLGFVSPFYFEGKLLGQIYLQYGLDELQKSLVQISGTVAVIILIVVLLSVFVSSRLQGLISRPILNLVEAMASVSARQDFSLRVKQAHKDEIGALIAGFNRMLSQLQTRDRELERHRQDLESLVGERTQELNRANRELLKTITELEITKDNAVQASMAKSQFLANMSHEIRTPMIGVLGMTELLFDTGLSERQQHLARTVFKSGEALLEIINDLLDFSKIEAGRMDLSSSDFSLAELVDEVVGLLQENASVKNLELNRQLAPDLPSMVSGDIGRIRQILLNLAGNALKFTEQGQVVIRVLPVDRSNPCLVRFEVEDSGVGIPEGSLESIFDTFTQGDDSTTRQFGGTGLGLAIVRQLTQLMEGKVTVSSQVGHGSCFRVELPLNPPALLSGATKPLPERFRNLRALLVIDDEELSLGLTRRLHGIGFQCETVTRGGHALQLLQSKSGSPINLVLVDADMSGLGGERLIDKIAQEASRDDFKVVFIAGQDHALQPSLSNARIDRWLYKPVQGEQFDHLLQELFTVDSAVPGSAPKTRVPPPEENGKRVLLVEDNRTAQCFVQGIINPTEYHLQITENGQLALEYLKFHQVDLILMDCQMPVMDGFETTWRIRQLGMKMPIIALTARVFPDDILRCQQSGMDDFIKKPFRPHELCTTISKWLDAELP